MALLSSGLRVLIALALVVALCACTAAQNKSPKTVWKADSTSNDKKAPVAKGATVSELGKSVMYVFQARNNDYWFGSNERGVYRYDGKVIVNFTMKDGLASN